MATSGLAVYGVYERLAVVVAHRPLEGGRIGRVDLERQVGDALHGLHRCLEDGRLVESGDADVDVEYVRAGLGLRHSFAQNVRGVSFRERGPEALLACRVDALSDDDGVA